MPFTAVKKTRTLADETSRFFYNKLTPKDLVLGRKEWRVAHKALWMTIRKHYIENEAGVYINHIGYLCHIMGPRVNFRINLKNRKELEGRIWHHVCIDAYPTSLNSMLSEENTRFVSTQPPEAPPFHFYFKNSVIQACRDEMVKNGKRYRFLYKEVFSQYLGKKNTFRLKEVVEKEVIGRMENKGKVVRVRKNVQFVKTK